MQVEQRTRQRTAEDKRERRAEIEHADRSRSRRLRKPARQVIDRCRERNPLPRRRAESAARRTWWPYARDDIAAETSPHVTMIRHIQSVRADAMQQQDCSALPLRFARRSGQSRAARRRALQRPRLHPTHWTIQLCAAWRCHRIGRSTDRESGSRQRSRHRRPLAGQLPKDSRTRIRAALTANDLRAGSPAGQRRQQRTGGVRSSVQYGLALVPAVSSLLNRARKQAYILAYLTTCHDESARHAWLFHPVTISSFSAQSTRPEAGPFDASRMEMQSPPPQGVADSRRPICSIPSPARCSRTR